MSRPTYARWVRRELKRRGCTCHPTVTMLPPPEARAAGANAGAVIRHQLGCPLGDRFIPLNNAGLIPAVVTYGTGCKR